MRWDSQRVEKEQGRSLPGLDVERVRTFDAPEALGINFHEVRAKSALNKVPGDFLPVQLDGQRLSRLCSCMHVLPGGRYTGPNGGRSTQADR